MNSTPRRPAASKNALHMFEANTIWKPQDLSSARFDPEMATIIDNMVVVTPEKFIKQNFDTPISPPPEFVNPFESMSKLWEGNSCPLESTMYPLLVEAFDKCCPTVLASQLQEPGEYRPKSSLKCKITGNMRRGNEAGSTVGLEGQMAPDLFVTFDGDKLDAFQGQPKGPPIRGLGILGGPSSTNPNSAPNTFHTHNLRSTQQGTSIGPSVLADTNQLPKSNTTPFNLFKYPGICVEVKPENNSDLGFESSEQRRHLSDKRKELLAQLFGYVEIAQWTALPYRFIWSITVTGTVLRIWRWSSTGVVVTDPIHYQADCTVVWQFLQAVGSGPYSRLGLDVGTGMTFSTVTQQGKARLKELTTCYSDAAFTFASKDWALRTERATMWKFEIGSAAYTDNDLLKDDRATSSNEAMPAEVESKSEGSNDMMTAKVEPKSEGSNQETSDSYLVLSEPIYQAIGLISRGTRCYLAIPERIFSSTDKISTRHLRTLKLSWQYISRHPEVHFFQEAKQRYGGHIPHLARVSAAGSYERTLQVKGRFLQAVEDGKISFHDISPLPDQTAGLFSDGLTTAEIRRQTIQRTSRETANRHRALNWILFKDVGGHISNHSNVQELLKALAGTLRAHRDLVKVNILHRDISANNVMINLDNREGLMIDLDMAEDLLERPAQMRMVLGDDDAPVLPGGEELPEDDSFKDPISRPVITGTLRYLSISLQRRPIHRDWHDLESFLWVLCFITIRHARNVMWVDTGMHDCDSDEDRTRLLQRLFPDIGPLGDNAMSEVTEAKQRFLSETKRLHVYSNPPLATLISDLLKIFRPLHHALASAHDFYVQIDRLHRRLELPFRPHPVLNSYSLPDFAQLQRYPNYLRAEASSLADRLSHKSQDPNLEKALQEEIKQTFGDINEIINDCDTNFGKVTTFPTSEAVIELFEAAASNPALDLTIKPYDYVRPSVNNRSTFYSSLKATPSLSIHEGTLENWAIRTPHNPQLHHDSQVTGQGSTSSNSSGRKRKSNETEASSLMENLAKRKRKSVKDRLTQFVQQDDLPISPSDMQPPHDDDEVEASPVVNTQDQ